MSLKTTKKVADQKKEYRRGISAYTPRALGSSPFSIVTLTKEEKRRLAKVLDLLVGGWEVRASKA
jgi:hypothetical protein